MNLNLKLTPYTKINSKWIVSLNVICKTVRFLDKNRRDLCDLGLGKEFLDLAAKPWSLKGKTDNVTLIKIKKFALWKSH